MNENKAECACGTVAELASDRNCPIVYDHSLNEYNLVSEDGKVRYRLYFCFFCGGKLPESKRASLFTEPSDKEMREVALLMAKVRSMQQAIEVLGKPDQTIKAPRTAQENGKSAYKSHHRYSSRWKTLDLTVRERADGSIDSAFTGKYKGEPSQSAKKAKRLS